MFSYLRFLFKSSNQHGVHSPFVYQYITKGLYHAEIRTHSKPKYRHWLTQTITYFNPSKIFRLCNYQLPKTLSLQIENNTFADAEVVVAHYALENEPLIRSAIQNMNTEQILLVTADRYPKTFFDEVRKNNAVIVMIDFYYGCLISKRTEQLKQNFFIRY